MSMTDTRPDGSWASSLAQSLPFALLCRNVGLGDISNRPSTSSV